MGYKFDLMDSVKVPTTIFCTVRTQTLFPEKYVLLFYHIRGTTKSKETEIQTLPLYLIGSTCNVCVSKRSIDYVWIRIRWPYKVFRRRVRKGISLCNRNNMTCHLCRRKKSSSSVTEIEGFDKGYVFRNFSSDLVFYVSF